MKTDRSIHRSFISVCAAVCIGVFSSGLAVAGTFIVNTTEYNDVPGDGKRSLNDAIAYANAHPGTTIVFNIPAAELTNGVAVVQYYAASSSDITADGTVIDGTTQTAFTGDTNPDGPEVEIELGQFEYAFGVNASNCTIKGLVFPGYSLGLAGSGNVVRGCYLGLAANGKVASGYQNTIGIVGDKNIIGGTHPSARNIIVGGNGYGSGIVIDGSRNKVLGNYIGTDATGNAPAQDDSGNPVFISNGVVIHGSYSRNQIGGVGQGQANRIAFAQRNGVEVEFANENPIRGNSIFSNGQGTVDEVFPGRLGINLLTDNEDSFGVTPNDPQDPDTGPNDLQNYPLLTSARLSNFTTTVTGTLNSEAGYKFGIDFYLNTATSPSGHGEGEEYIGKIFVRTDKYGNAVFSKKFILLNQPLGKFISSTATKFHGKKAQSTSEFSNTVEVKLPPDQTGGTTASSTSSAQAAPAESSTALASADASSAKQEVTLTFTVALNGFTASDASRFSAEVNGEPVAIKRASYDQKTWTVTLRFDKDSLPEDEAVEVWWANLLDASNRALPDGGATPGIDDE
jgi:hypothetical protein